MKRIFKMMIVSAGLVSLFAGTRVSAVTNTYSSLATLQTGINSAASNDVLVLADGTYTDNITLTIGRNGVTVRPVTPGGAYLNNIAAINITGNNNTFSGFQFTSRTISTNGIIITVSGSRNLLTQLNFDGYQAQKYINLQGQYDEVSYCNFRNKPVTAQIGNLIHTALSPGIPGYHKIRYCSFQDMPGAGGDNGNECIRLENGAQSTYIGRTVVEFNYFNNTGPGDSEVISVKCRENVIRYNTMTNNLQGNFCFRNGDSNIAYGNFFIKSGGIRVKEANDTYCYNNYFENCGDGNITAPVLYVYYTANTTNVLRNINFFHNTFVGGTSIDFDTGATQNTWANNIFSNTANIFIGSASGVSWAGNQYSGTLGITIPSGMTKTNSLLVRNPAGYYVPASNSPAINAASTNYPAILDITGVDDDPSLLLDISGLPRPASAILKDVGCSEYTTGTAFNHPLALSDVGPSYLGGPSNIVNVAPNVDMFAPTNGAGFAGPASVSLAANAVDPDGTITSVSFYNGSTLLGTDTTAPYVYTWTNVPAGSYSLMARATDNSGAVSTSAVVAVTVWLPPPGSNFDLSHWYLQLPTSNGLLTGAAGSVDSATAAQLTNGYTSDYFYTAANGSMAFFAPNNGACTSGSTHPRSELREQLNPPNNNSWTVYGTHIMTATLKVTQVSPDTGKVCIGQMKGGYKVDGSAATNTEHMIMFDLNSQEIYANINPDGNSNKSYKVTFVSGSAVALSNTITYTMSMVDGLLTMTVNGITTSCDLLSGSAYSGLIATNWDRASSNALYFKAGSYNQATNGLADQGARVEFSSLTRYHSANITNQPASVTNRAGSNVTFTVGASGNGTLGYQWMFNGANISNKTSATLSLTNISTADAGNYTVVVSDNTSSFSAITSAVATLTVLTNAGAVVDFAVPGVTNWLCPSNVTSVQVECWGGGGAGGSAQRPNGGTSTTQYGGGGGGGAYAKYISYPVTPGNTYYINVGAGGTNSSTSNDTVVVGGDSWFNTNNAPSSVIIAKGGAGGQSSIGNTTTTRYGLGGTGTTNGSAGDVVYAGGSGFTATNSQAGGGGSSAGTGANGTSATNNVGAPAPAGGGAGGTGSTGTSSANGGNGSFPGGAGSGALANNATLRAGGTGSVGRITLTYTFDAVNVAPSVSLTAPTNGASYTAPASIALTADASDSDGVVTSVDFYNGSTLLGSDTNPPYAYTWANVPAGSYTLTARATDNDGAVSTSAVVAVTVVDATYALTVNSGTGDGSYTNGAQVTITADAPAVGKAFDRWTGDTQFVASVSSASTTVTMPAQAVALTATYVDVYYALTVTGGSGSGSYTNGQQVAITADAPAVGKAFAQWIGDTQVVNNATFTNALVTMSTNAVTLIATYVDVYYTLTVTGGNGSGFYTNTQAVDISADAPSTGMTFDRWTGATQVVASVSSASTTVTMPPQAVALSSTYKILSGWNTLTVSNGTGSGIYSNGVQVAITADAPASGKVFVQWTGDTQYVNNVTLTNALVNMPTNPVLLVATYKDIFATLLDVNFETNTVGLQPAGQGAVFSPSVNTTSNHIVVIGSPTNTAGTGNGVEFLDDNSSVTTRFEYDLSSPQSAIRWDFSFSPLKTDGPGSNYVNAAVVITNGSTGSSANRFCSLRLYENGTIRWQAGATVGQIGSTLSVASGSLHRVSMFLNDTTNALSYTDPNGIGGNPLAADSVVFWMDGTNYSGGLLLGGGTNGTISGGTSGLAKVGFGSTTTAIQLKYAFDDIKVTQILQEFVLTVTGGSGGGSYISGAQVAITADAPASGKVFDQWTGDTQYVASVTSSNTTVTMPAQAIALTATYKDAAVYYTLTGSTGINGTVSPASTNVLAGSSASFVVTASNYYRIATLTTNGTSVTGMLFDNNSTTTNFTWSNVQTSGVLAATFTNQVANDPAGTPYSWLAQYGLTNYNTDAVADQDSDGLTAWQEYIAGTDPTNAASCFKAAQNIRNTITWSAVSGRVYSVYWSTNLVKGFQSLETNILYPQSSYTNATPDFRVNHYQVKVRLQ